MKIKLALGTCGLVSKQRKVYWMLYQLSSCDISWKGCNVNPLRKYTTQIVFVCVVWAGTKVVAAPEASDVTRNTAKGFVRADAWRVPRRCLSVTPPRVSPPLTAWHTPCHKKSLPHIKSNSCSSDTQQLDSTAGTRFLLKKWILFLKNALPLYYRRFKKAIIRPWRCARAGWRFDALAHVFIIVPS